MRNDITMQHIDTENNAVCAGVYVTEKNCLNGKRQTS